MTAHLSAALFGMLAGAAGGALTPTSPQLRFDPGTRVEWSTLTGHGYQLQSAETPEGPWIDLGPSIAGDGQSRSFFDPGPLHRRSYRIVEEVPATPAAPPFPGNGGFESGTGTVADQWSTAGNTPPARSAEAARSGSFGIRSRLVNVGAQPREGQLVQSVNDAGGAIVPGQAYEFSFWARQVSSGPSYLQQYEMQWLDSAGAVVGTTGLKSFGATIGEWTEIIETGLTAPASAAGASVRFRFVTGAVEGGHGEVLIDDVALSGGNGEGEPGETRHHPLDGRPTARISWPTTPSVLYQPETTTNLDDWTPLSPPVLGDGGIHEMLIPAVEDTAFYRVAYPDPPAPPPVTGIVPLHGPATLLEPPTTVTTPEALITHIADRARDRHAREDMFQAYDHYLSWYWEDRTIAVEIVDRVAQGGSGVTFNYTTLTPLGSPDFRAFFRGINTVAEYYTNVGADLVGPNQYSVTLNNRQPGGAPLAIGDRIEIEISQFLEAPANGRKNYYGTTMLYIVGRGIVPWEGITLPGGPPLDSYPLPEETWLGGLTSLPYPYSDEPDNRFKQMAGNISPTNAQPFLLGRRLHHTDFRDGSHSESGNPDFTVHADKLGPAFISRSCVECHVNNGRALPPAIGQPMLRSVVKTAADAAGTPHPVLGHILQPQTTFGDVEGSATLAEWIESTGQYGDGSAYSLRRPVYAFDGTAPYHFSVRLAPPLVGMGLLEAIDEQSIVALADPEDSNGDGISGRWRTVTDLETGDTRLGRFTAKGGQASLRHQIASALNTDMGVTTAVFPILDGETEAGPVELGDPELDRLTRYIALLGVPSQRNYADPQVVRGKQLFTAANCIACHTPQHTTSPHHPMAELRIQTIRPYTDLLLHDMGPGLADNLGEEEAGGAEWRTPPLWGIGLTAGVSGGEAYLHDGRARTLEEAILWHGGEGEASKEAFRTMPAADRAALIAFLRSL
ncbi:di-heme oxidoredictase family protein [Haloferula sp. A504]|uniref:di-heme oxidoredictase family protein n=1 Tax=Haloferula sp. A504 TaxID=3373601 RepID=UPI0031C7EF02|nr:c-type cytochrome [Verrucomicrobiaceae bacterium E54]